MNPTSVIALFCEDVREERSGTLTLLGVLGDNAGIPPPPPHEPQEGKQLIPQIPRLGLYVRINFDVEADIGPLIVRVRMPDGSVLYEAPIGEATIEEARATRDRGNPIAGVIQRVHLGGLPVTQLGRMTVEVEVGDQSYLAGFLNFVTEEPSTTSAASALMLPV